MKKLRLPTFIILILASFLLIGAQRVEQKVVEAIRAAGEIEIDGFLKENTRQTRGYSDFTQRDPKDGEPPTERTVFWVAFDDEAIYVAARCESSLSSKIIKLSIRLSLTSSSPSWPNGLLPLILSSKNSLWQPRRRENISESLRDCFLLI